MAKLIDIEKEKTIKIGNIEIKKIKAFHSVKTTGFKFFAPEFTLAYSSDTRFDNKLIEEYKNTDILILNVTSKLKQENNLSISDAEKIIKKVKPKLTIITHFNDLEDPISEARILAKKTSTQVISSHEGMIINPRSYSAETNQRTLVTY